MIKSQSSSTIKQYKLLNYFLAIFNTVISFTTTRYNPLEKEAKSIFTAFSLT